MWRGRGRGGETFGKYGRAGRRRGGGLLSVCRLFMYVYQNIPRKAILAGAPGRGEQDMNSQDLIKGD